MFNKNIFDKTIGEVKEQLTLMFLGTKPFWQGLLISAIVLAITLPLAYILPERYPDFIAEYLAFHAIEKTWEIRGLWLALFAGLLALAGKFYKLDSLGLERVNYHGLSNFL